MVLNDLKAAPKAPSIIGPSTPSAEEVDSYQADVEAARRDLADGAEPIKYVREALRHRDQNRYGTAEAILQEVILRHPTVEAGYYELAFMHRLKHQPRKAVQILDRGITRARGSRLPLLRGHMLHACGAHEEAVAALNEVAPSDDKGREALRAMVEFGAYLKRFPLGRALVMLDRQKERSGWLNTAEVAKRIGEALQAAAPFALIRLGDGEGAMLRIDEADEAAYETLYTRNRAEFIRIWFGERFDWRNGKFMCDAQSLSSTIAHCDVIGAPYESWIKHEYGISSLRGVPSLVNVYRLFAQNISIANKPICSQHVHLDLFKDGHLIPIIKAGQQINVVSCLPDIANILRERLGLGDVKLYVIPAEQGSLSRLGADVGSGVHYPDAFIRLQSDLARPQNGALFLVAAGLLGKFYCETVRRYGGIALDIGSLVDGWAGKATRPGYGQDLRL